MDELAIRELSPNDGAEAEFFHLLIADRGWGRRP